uniref:ADP-ribosylation factor-like protein 6-interacting protein 4 n=1 Tax=Lygus hesperus TaxID=30085 RepID=A0A0A9YPC9_LYGHE
MEKKKNKLEKPLQPVDEGADIVGPQVPLDLPKMEEERPKMAPMTKEEWDKRQSVIRRVYDETTGRHRLIKGDGEVLEEIVSRDRHKEINRLATAGDGAYFQSKLPQPHQ